MSNKGIFSPKDVKFLMDFEQYPMLGQLELIQTQNITTAQSSVIFSNLQNDKYQVHFLIASNYHPATNDRLGMQFFESGTLESGSVYHIAYRYGYYCSSFGHNKSTSSNHIKICPDEEDDTGDSSSGYCYIYNAADPNQYTFTTQQMVGTDYFRFGGGCLPQKSVVDGIKLFGDDNGQDFTGTFSLYGIRFT
mgnify:FL=1